MGGSQFFHPTLHFVACALEKKVGFGLGLCCTHLKMDVNSHAWEMGGVPNHKQKARRKTEVGGAGN